MPKEPTDIIRTTIYLPRSLHEQTKIMAILTQKGLSDFIRISIRDKIKELKDGRRQDPAPEQPL